MSVEVILMSDVKDLGAEGDVVRVANGYARNFLIPQKLAAPVTEATRRRLAKIRQEREVQRQKALETARTVANALGKASYTIRVKVGAEEKLFGSVTNADIAAVLHEQGFEVDRHAIVLEEPIRELGVYDVPVKLHPEVVATVKLWIVEE